MMKTELLKRNRLKQGAKRLLASVCAASLLLGYTPAFAEEDISLYEDPDDIGIVLVEEEPAEEVPAEEPTETPEETPAEETGAEETGPAPAETEAEEVHTHVFSDTWSYDGSTHWRECECGERTEQGAHTLEWKLTRRATKKIAGIETGTCTTCGYTVTRETDYDGISDGLRLAIVGVAGLTALTILVLIVDSIRTSIKRRKRRKKKRSASHVKK